MMHIKFWGVRGSCASAGADTAEVGGNTSCVEVRVGETRMILDAGTGLRGLGAEMMKQGGETGEASGASRGASGEAVPSRMPGEIEAHLLLSHFHWDHIQGFPFFTPAYVKGNRIEIYGPERAAGRDVRAALDAQMRPPHFPVGLEAMRAGLGFYPVPAGAAFKIGPFTVETAAANHPGGCIAYRLNAEGRSVVYATDTEHFDELDPNLLELARGCDVLICDAQYTAAEYAQKRGWGHSTPEEAVELARAAGAKQLILFHHDPAHDDAAITRMENAARAVWPTTTAAREGLEIVLSPKSAKQAA